MFLAQSGSHFVIYVDSEWSNSRGFRLFEIFHAEAKGPWGVVQAGTVLAKEWVSKVIPGVTKSKGGGQTFLPKYDKARR